MVYHLLALHDLRVSDLMTRQTTKEPQECGHPIQACDDEGTCLWCAEVGRLRRALSWWQGVGRCAHSVIEEHWDALLDESGAGPINLLARLQGRLGPEGAHEEEITEVNANVLGITKDMAMRAAPNALAAQDEVKRLRAAMRAALETSDSTHADDILLEALWGPNEW